MTIPRPAQSQACAYPLSQHAGEGAEPVSQNDAVLAWLKAGHSLTPLEALERFRCLRLAARVADLRLAGYRIETTIRRQGRKFHAEYQLANESEQAYGSDAR